MSRLRLTRVAVPATPAADKSELFVDTADRRTKQVDDLGVLNVLSPSGWRDRNLLINGGWDFSQRAAVALNNITGPSATARIFSADRWGFTIGNVTTPQFQQVDTIAANESGITARYYARYKQLTNAAKMCVSQVIAGYDMASLRGRVVRLQFKMRYSVGSNRNMRLGLLQLNSAGTVDTMPASFIPAFNGASTDPTFGTNLALIAPTLVDNGTIVGSAMNCPITNAWQRFSATFLVPTNCVNLIAVIFNDTIGVANDDLLLTEAGLYDGQEIRDWCPRPRAQELGLCLQYYAKTFAIGTVPAQSAGVVGALRGLVAIAGAVATSSCMQWKFPVPMRATPGTIVFFNPSAANAFLRNVPAATDATATAAASSSPDGIDINATGLAAWAVGQEMKVHATADAEL